MPQPLSTTMNSGVPYGAKRSKSAKPKSAAGVLFVTPDGEGLFIKRKRGDHAGTWALPAGYVEKDEKAEDAARRETIEEIGRLPGWKLTPIKREIRDGVDFSTFGQRVEDRFDCVLNDESESAVWAPLDDPPDPLHPGVAALLAEFFGEEEQEEEHASPAAQSLRNAFEIEAQDGADRENVAQELAEHFERARGRKPSEEQIDRLLAIFFEEEARESAHRAEDYNPYLTEFAEKETAIGQLEGRLQGKDYGEITNQSNPKMRRFVQGLVPAGELGALNGDAALRIIFDEKSVRSFDNSGRMQVKVAHISKTQIRPYKGDEIPDWEVLGLDPDRVYQMYCPAEELKKSAKTFNGVQLLKKHLPVDADDHQMWDIVGTTGSEARFKDPYLDNSLFIWTRDGIDLIESKEQKELSCGYSYRAEMTPGTFEGERYDGIMRDIEGNHVALVTEGRAGHDVAVGDSVEEMQWMLIEEALMGLGAS